MAAIKANDPSSAGANKFALGKQNYILIGIGSFVVILGFFLISGGGAPDEYSFSWEIFNFRRMFVAPLVILAGYGIVMYGIIRK